VWTNNKPTKLKILFIQDIVIKQEEKKYIKQSIYSTTYSVSVGCFVEKTPENRIEKIKKGFNLKFQGKLLS
jgi:hypothetical protein